MRNTKREHDVYGVLMLLSTSALKRFAGLDVTQRSLATTDRALYGTVPHTKFYYRVRPPTLMAGRNHPEVEWFHLLQRQSALFRLSEGGEVEFGRQVAEQVLPLLKSVNRVEQAGYGAHRIVGESIAVGATSAQEGNEGWLASPTHCENITDEIFTKSESGMPRAATQARVCTGRRSSPLLADVGSRSPRSGAHQPHQAITAL